MGKHRTLIIVAVAATLFVCGTITCNAEVIASGECGEQGGNVIWSLDENGTLTISGEGEMEDYPYLEEYEFDDVSQSYDHRQMWQKDRPYGDLAGQIKKVVIQDGVTAIGSTAFKDFTLLTKIEIPNSVKYIGRRASDDGVFSGCSSLTSITIPDGVTEIGYRAFAGCRSLASATIPDSITRLSCGSFSRCENLTNITIPDSVKTIDDSSFFGSGLINISLPNGVRSIGRSAFSECSNLRSITIPGSVVSIGDDAFSGCGKLKKIGVDSHNIKYSSKDGVFFTKNQSKLILYPPSKEDTKYKIPKRVKQIEACAFTNCSHLTSVTIPDSVTKIGYRAFAGCSGLKSIKRAKGVIEIEQGAFFNCTKLENIILSNRLKSIGEAVVFYDSIDERTDERTGVFENCINLKKIIIPKRVVEIGCRAFACSGVSTIVVKTKRLNDCYAVGENCFKDSKVKTVKVKVGNKKQNKTYVKKYKKIFTKKNVGRKVVVK